jgi:hypothetical protein
MGWIAIISKQLGTLNKSNAKNIIKKVTKKSLTDKEEKVLNSFKKQVDEDLITESEFQAKAIQEFVLPKLSSSAKKTLKDPKSTISKKQYKINFHHTSPVYEQGKTIGRSQGGTKNITINASSKEEAKKILKNSELFQKSFKYIEDRRGSNHGPTRLVINKMIEKKVGGMVMKDYNKNYNKQRTI